MATFTVWTRSTTVWRSAAPGSTPIFQTSLRAACGKDWARWRRWRAALRTSSPEKPAWSGAVLSPASPPPRRAREPKGPPPRGTKPWRGWLPGWRADTGKWSTPCTGGWLSSWGRTPAAPAGAMPPSTSRPCAASPSMSSKPTRLFPGKEARTCPSAPGSMSPPSAPTYLRSLIEAAPLSF